MKKIFFSMAFIFTSSFANNDLQKMTDNEEDVSSLKFTSSEKEYISPSFITSQTLVVKPMQITGFDQTSRKKLDSAFDVLEHVVNSEEFKDRVINFKNSKGQRQFASNKGLSNEEIYQLFMEGRETLQQNTPGEMNFFLKLYNRPWSRVIGYTSGDTNIININWKYFKNYKPGDVASNLAHEWTHKIGFNHISAKELDSAPYAIGYIVQDLAETFLKNNELH